MPRGQLDKNEMKVHILKLKNQIYYEPYDQRTKDLANRYMNLLLDKLEEYVR